MIISIKLIFILIYISLMCTGALLIGEPRQAFGTMLIAAAFCLYAVVSNDR